MEDTLEPFQEHWLIRGGWMQTVAGAKAPGKIELPQRKTHKIPVGKHAVVLALELEGQDPHKPLVIMAHGMGGCSESGYMRRIARRLWDRGCGVLMMNHRGSGPGMGLSDSLWHGGSSADFDKLIQHALELYPKRQMLLVGFSLSGNILLKYLGEGRKIPTNIHGAYAVNPPIDLKVSSEILSSNNGAFNSYYVKLLRSQAQAMQECFPEAVHPKSDYRTIRDFDIVYTAPAAGFRDVEEYYGKCSANQFLESIHVPTTILCAQNDPFIPPRVFEPVLKNFTLTFNAPEGGGHMGYISGSPTALGDRRWLDYAIVKWVENTE